MRILTFISLLLIGATTSSCRSQTSYSPIKPSETKYPESLETNVSSCTYKDYISLNSSQAISVETRTGDVAKIRLYGFVRNTAQYQWKYRARETSEIKSGHGSVIEDYERKVGDTYYPSSSDMDKLTIKAGEIWLEWSSAVQSGWIYFCPEIARVRIISLDEFRQPL